MPPSRPRPSRSTPPDRAVRERAPADASRAEQSWSDDADAPPSPLGALVDAAAEAGVVDTRGLADRLGIAPASLRDTLARPDTLTREQRDALATALGVDGAVVRAACRATSASPAAALGTSAPAITPVDTPADAPGDPPPDEPPVARASLPAAESELPGAQPATLIDLLERTVAAVADDALGRRVRLSLLTTVQTAAAEAGRLVPPELHELRGRVSRGAVPWIGDGGVFVDDPNAGDDHALLVAVATAIRAAQAQDSGYDDLFAPLHDDALDALLRRVTASARPAALGATSACAVTPPLYGRHLVVCSADASSDQRRLALRRAVGHILLGHVGELAPLPFPAPAPAARAADVFALADLVPFWQLHDWRRKARLGWSAIMAEVARVASSVAGDWDAARAGDAARLRVLLYRERGL